MFKSYITSREKLLDEVNGENQRALLKKLKKSKEISSKLLEAIRYSRINRRGYIYQSGIKRWVVIVMRDLKVYLCF